jgi:membrane fusion protein, heavy metal efflux system
MKQFAAFAAAVWVMTAMACGGRGEYPAAEKKDAPPAKVTGRVKEADLTRVELTEQAAQRLGIEIEEAADREMAEEMLIAGDLMLPPGKALLAPAPVGGKLEGVTKLTIGRRVQAGETLLRVTPLLPVERDLRVAFEADLRSAQARMAAARANLERARQLLADRAGSQRNQEAAEQEERQAAAAEAAAQARLRRLDTRPLEADVRVNVTAPASGMIRQIFAEPGQVVSGGANLFEVADFSTLWLRVPIYAGESKLTGKLEAVTFDDMSGRGEARQSARRVTAPPTADPLTVTVDQYFAVENAAGQWQPGQRVRVHVPGGGKERGLAVAEGSVVYDVQGAAWVYVEEAPRVYRRVAVEPVRTQGGYTLLARGPASGARVVKAGAAELFGTEFGAGK